MTPEEWARLLFGPSDSGPSEAEVAAAIQAAVAGEAERWREATRHSEGCPYPRAVMTALCDCGAHGLLVILHAARAQAARRA